MELRGLGMEDLRDLKDLTIRDVKSISDESTTGRRHSLGDSTDQVNRGAPMFGNGTALAGLRNTGTEACITHAPGMRPGILTGYEPVAGEPRE